MKITIIELKRLNEEIKKGGEIGKAGYHKLLGFKLEEFTPGLLLYRSYLIGKYQCNQFKETGKICFLEEAMVSFDTIFELANEHKIGVRNPKFWFKRIKTMLEYQTLKKGRSSSHLLVKCIRLLDRAKTHFPENTSFTWLEQAYNINN